MADSVAAVFLAALPVAVVVFGIGWMLEERPSRSPRPSTSKRTTRRATLEPRLLREPDPAPPRRHSISATALSMSRLPDLIAQSVASASARLVEGLALIDETCRNPAPQAPSQPPRRPTCRQGSTTQHQNQVKSLSSRSKVTRTTLSRSESTSSPVESIPISQAATASRCGAERRDAGNSDPALHSGAHFQGTSSRSQRARRSAPGTLAPWEPAHARP